MAQHLQHLRWMSLVWRVNWQSPLPASMLVNKNIPIWCKCVTFFGLLLCLITSSIDPQEWQEFTLQGLLSLPFCLPPTISYCVMGSIFTISAPNNLLFHGMCLLWLHLIIMIMKVLLMFSSWCKRLSQYQSWIHKYSIIGFFNPALQVKDNIFLWMIVLHSDRCFLAT